jgi:chemotaxis protein histidine kinase CheA
MSNTGSRERQQLAVLEDLDRKLQHIHGLVERFAGDSQNAEQWSTAIRRAFAHLKLSTSSEGFDSMAQLCGAMDAVAKRTGGRQLKIRLLRETVASLRSQIETEARIARMSAQREEQLEERRKEEREKEK